jgi:hypothetical protein
MESPGPVPYQELLEHLAQGGFKEIDYNHVSKDKNRNADALAILAALTHAPKQGVIKSFDGLHRTGNHSVEEVNQAEHLHGDPWFTEILNFL